MYQLDQLRRPSEFSLAFQEVYSLLVGNELEDPFLPAVYFYTGFF